MHNLDFTNLAPIEIPVTIAGEEPMVLREATAGAARDWRAAIIRSQKVDGRGFDASITETELLLVSLCLFYKAADAQGNARRVPVATVRNWQNRITKSLFETAKEISGLIEEDTEESLEKDIATAQEKLAKLKEEREKNGQRSGRGTTSSV